VGAFALFFKGDKIFIRQDRIISNLKQLDRNKIREEYDMQFRNKNAFTKINLVGLFCFALLTHSAGHAMENKSRETLNQKGMLDKALAVIGKSSMMHRYNQWYAGKTELPGEPVSEEMQALGKEAQTAVGIPEDRQLPVRYVAGIDGAEAGADAIVVGDYKEDAYGVNRCLLFHEAIHVKYHDTAVFKIPFPSSIIGALIATKLCIKPQGIAKLLYLPALIAGAYVGDELQTSFAKYRERRADIEGHYATQCHTCVTEKSEHQKSVRDFITDGIALLEAQPTLTDEQTQALTVTKGFLERQKSYLSVEENSIIAADLKRDNKICTFHEKQ